MQSTHGDNALLISVDPESPTTTPFVEETELFNLPITAKLIKGLFPLAEGSEDGKAIIDKIVNFPGHLILVNAMGSQYLRNN